MMKGLFKALFSERQRINFHYLFFKMRALFYCGNAVHCNCCKKSFRTFLVYGNQKRKNAACPYCNSLERNRVLLFYLEQETTLFTAKNSVLHFAPERILSHRLKGILYIDYYGVDINPALADHVVDIMDIPFPDQKFDLIICSHVLGHVPDEGKAIREMYRVLHPSGVAIIMTVRDLKSEKTIEDATTITPQARLEKYGESDLLRLHGLDFSDRLRNQGFTVEEIDYIAMLGEKMYHQYSLGNGKRETIFKCTK